MRFFPETITVAERITEILSLLQKSRQYASKNFLSRIVHAFTRCKFSRRIGVVQVKMVKIIQTGLFGVNLDNSRCQ